MRLLSITLSALLALLPLTSTTSVGDAVNLTCADQTYNPRSYTCYRDVSPPILCAKAAGVDEENCGRACYNPLRYTCDDDGSLAQLPVYTGPVVLQVIRPDATWDGQYIQASGLHLFVGGNNSAYCPSNLPASACQELAVTVFQGPSSMSSRLPHHMLMCSRE
jgi:hypothetical protein